MGGNKIFFKKRDDPGWHQKIFQEERCPWVATKYFSRREMPLGGNKIFMNKKDAPRWQKNIFEDERCPWVATKYFSRREMP